MASTGRELLREVVGGQVAELVGSTGAVRRDDDDAVHQARVTTRRLRSELRAFRPLVEPTVAAGLRDELRWWGRVLGEARDREVQRDSARALLDELPDYLVVGPVRARVTGELDAAHAVAHAGLVEALNGGRYAALVEKLGAFAADPPTTDRAERSARHAARRASRRMWRRVRRRARDADRWLTALTATDLDPTGLDATGLDPTNPELAHGLHELRKAAKSARYAAEAVTPLFGADAVRLAQAYEDLQDVLGAHHDAVESAALYRAMGMRAHLAAENGFTYGLLVEHERSRARAALAEAPGVWRTASDRRLRRWAR